MGMTGRIAFAAAALLLAGCSSSGGTAPRSPAPSAPSASLSAAAQQSIKEAYLAFFDPKSSAEQVAAKVQHGDKFIPEITGLASSQYSSASGVEVTAVSGRSPSVAQVTFTVTVGGQAMLPDVQGYAVLSNGTWTMAAKTFCDLLALDGTKAAACSDPSVTDLPS